MPEFVGTGLALDADGFAAVTDQLGVTAAELWAVLTVETRASGFLPDRRPVILFERHVFHRETGGRFDGDPEISDSRPGGYGAAGPHRYDRLARALACDRRAALRSASWGVGQLMGFNAEIAGFADVEAMVAAMMNSENDQLAGMAGELAHGGLERYLRAQDWAAFARRYNGPNYAVNQYDSRLAAAHRKFVAGPLPDFHVRGAQLYLTYLGYAPGPIDGVMGRLTRDALQQFQATEGLPLTEIVDDDVLAVLRHRAIGV